jgi:predicted transposase/invertase (TIGR01784 family)
MVFNTSKAYVSQLGKGEEYELLQPVYGLAIINSVFDHKTPEFYHHYQTVNRKNTGEVIKGLEFVLVELPKFRPESWTDRKMAVLWLRFLREVKDEIQTVPEELLSNEDISKALDLCERGAFTDGELEAYDKYWDAVSVEKSLLSGSYAEGKAKGEAIGMQKGEAIGMQKGEAIGMQKGLRNVVLKAHRERMPLPDICNLTGFSEEEVDKIIHTAGK